MPRALRPVAVLVALLTAGSASAGIYTVRRGDTLSAIAARNHTTVSALMTINAIRNPSLIRVGQAVQVTAGEPPPADATVYVVRAGDTLGVLAGRFHTTVSALMATNGITNSGTIRAGMTLRLSTPPTPPTTPKPTKSGVQLIAVSRPANPGYHIVQPGDTVASVAAALGVSVVALAAANGITDDRLYVGARLTTAVSAVGQPLQPAFPFVAQPTYVIVAGDSLASVAAHAHVTKAALAATNGLPANARPAVGTRLFLPGAWVCPVTGPIFFVNDWGFPRPGPTWHEGIDLMAPRGTPVVAPVSGLLQRDPNPKGGNAFNLYGADGNRYYGAHLDSFGAQGKVTAGTVIGHVGNTGDAEGGATHLHFEIHPSGGPAVPPYPTVTLACRQH